MKPFQKGADVTRPALFPQGEEVHVVELKSLHIQPAAQQGHQPQLDCQAANGEGVAAPDVLVGRDRNPLKREPPPRDGDGEALDMDGLAQPGTGA